MLYLSKGIAEKDSTENLIKVRRGDYTYTVSGMPQSFGLPGVLGLLPVILMKKSVIY